MAPLKNTNIRQNTQFAKKLLVTLHGNPPSFMHDNIHSECGLQVMVQAWPTMTLSPFIV